MEFHGIPASDHNANRGVHCWEVLRRTGHVDGAAAGRLDHGEDLLRAVGAVRQKRDDHCMVHGETTGRNPGFYLVNLQKLLFIWFGW